MEKQMEAEVILHSAAEAASSPADQGGRGADQLRPTIRFRTRIKGCDWGEWRRPGIDGWRIVTAIAEIDRPNGCIDGFCVEHVRSEPAAQSASTPQTQPSEGDNQTGEA